MPSNVFNVQVKFDDATLIALARMRDWEVRLYPNMEAAMYKSLDDVESMAQDWMWMHFKNPQGALEEAFEKSVVSADLAILENTSAYGQRRNYGFSGMTDALGRYYPNDPGIEWAENAVQNATPYVQMRVWEALNRTITGIGVP